jgi:hypothetical protein
MSPTHVWVFWQVCGCFGNMCTCIYCVLYCLYSVFVFICLCLFILTGFVCKDYCHWAKNQLQLIMVIKYKTYYYTSHNDLKVHGTRGIPASHIPKSMLLLLPTAGNYKVQHRVTNGTTFVQSFVQNIKSISQNLNRQTHTHACSSLVISWAYFFQLLVKKFE